jgi:prevent-host-death family protein
VESALHSTRSLNDLGINFEKTLLRLRRTRKPVLLTKNGKPEFMLIDARKLPKKISAKRLERLIEEAEADIAAGRYEDFDQYMKRFRNAHNL